MTTYVRDTNILTALVKNQQQAMRQFQDANNSTNYFLLCPLVWYESRRGLQWKEATRQLQRLQTIVAAFDWQDYTRDDWTLAATWWARLRRNGLQITDADLMIAVYAHRRNATLVTDNTKDFSQLDVTTANWLA